MRIIIPKDFVQSLEAVKAFYGVRVEDRGDVVVVTVDDVKSGVKPEFRAQIKSALISLGFSEEAATALVEHNPLQYIVLLAALAAGAYFLYRNWSQLQEYFWKVILPLLTFGLGVWVASKAFG